jgi:hypothetical protein
MNDIDIGSLQPHVTFQLSAYLSGDENLAIHHRNSPARYCIAIEEFKIQNRP